MIATVQRRQPTPLEAEAAFLARVAQLRGKVLGPYVNTRTAVVCVCVAGHPCRPRPNNVLRGQGICGPCSGNDRAAAEQWFRERIAELGGQVVGRYAGKDVTVDCICSNGHPCRPSPTSVQQGNGICRTCSGNDSALAEMAFRAQIALLGGHVVGEYVNAQTPVSCTCADGHPCQPWPTSVQRGVGICPVCAGNDTVTAEVAFRRRVVELGGQVVGEYVNAKTPVGCICPAGHPCRPRPANMGQGEGMCRFCCGKEWDAFYIVLNPALARVKIGITSHDAARRLSEHRYAGYTDIVRVCHALPDAAKLERHALNTLRDAGILPVHGREYYDQGALAVVLDVVDGWCALSAPLIPALGREAQGRAS